MLCESSVASLIAWVFVGGHADQSVEDPVQVSPVCGQAVSSAILQRASSSAAGSSASGTDEPTVDAIVDNSATLELLLVRPFVLFTVRECLGHLSLPPLCVDSHGPCPFPLPWTPTIVSRPPRMWSFRPSLCWMTPSLNQTKWLPIFGRLE